MKLRTIASLLAITALTASNSLAGEPALPDGLDGAPSEPSLPSGLGQSSEPSLPSGLGNMDSYSSASADLGSDWRDDLPFDLSGFAESRFGARIHDDRHEKSTSIGEARLHLKASKSWDNVTANLTTDLLYDPVLDRHQIDLETGQGWLDLREANLVFSPTNFSDVKIGRQILTWGTGDLIFINDMFPKDWNSFFNGRDTEYLKAPSDALKLALYSDIANLDVVYTPNFDSDRHIDGRRISYFSGNTGQIEGRNLPIITDGRSQWFSEDELALRAHRLIGTYETALYYYNGYWKSPNGQDGATGLYTFPSLSVYGASMRGPLAGGIFNAEMGYYASRDDKSGDNPLIRNSEFRFLAGYEHEILPELTGSVQYYLERMSDYDNYRNFLPAGANAKDEYRHLVTLRLTKMLMNQNLTMSLFNFYSPSDNDGYIRPKVNYKIDDNWTAELAGNIFYGKNDYTFFGGFEDNSNVYASIRYGF